MLATTGTANASGVCGPDMRWIGSAGEVTAQLGPTGFVQWGARDYTDNGGLWLAYVSVGRRQVDRKEQAYQPHGSVNPKDFRSGQVLAFSIYHVDTHGNKSLSSPDANCVIP